MVMVMVMQSFLMINLMMRQNKLRETQDAQNSTVISPDAAHNQQAMVNQTNSTHAAGSGDVVNTTGNATGNYGPKNFLPATGNPVVILLGCLAVIGGVSVFRKK